MRVCSRGDQQRSSLPRPHRGSNCKGRGPEGRFHLVLAVDYQLDKIHYRVRNNSNGQVAANELVSINSDRALTPEQYRDLADIPPKPNGSPTSLLRRRGASIKPDARALCVPDARVYEDCEASWQSLSQGWPRLVIRLEATPGQCSRSQDKLRHRATFRTINYGGRSQ